MKARLENRIRTVSVLAIAALCFSSPRTGNASSKQVENAVRATSPIHVGSQVSEEATMNTLDAIERDKTKTAGIDIKSPAFNADGDYKAFSDNGKAALSGDEWLFNLSSDADLCKGLIGGLGYGLTYRDADGSGSSEHLLDHALSAYTGKQLFDILNVGASIAWITSDHDLRGGNKADLDSESWVYTGFVGVSKTWNKLTASTTGSLFYDTEFFQKKGALQTWSFNWSGSLAYRFVERWRLAFNWAYNYVFDDDTLGGAKPGDRDCWTVGPRLDFQATDKVSMNLGYSYADGPSHFNAQTVRVGVGIQF